MARYIYEFAQASVNTQHMVLLGYPTLGKRSYVHENTYTGKISIYTHAGGIFYGTN